MTSQDPRIYIRILQDVREQITDGILSGGKPVPPITVLCRQYDCTRQTAAKALRLLEDDGLLTRYPGLGYYVTD